MKHDNQDLPKAPDTGQRYEISRRLREEPWGEVWLARDRLLGVEVGLKVLPREAPEWTVAQRYYEQEAALALKLRHPDLLGVFHLERADSNLFLVQEPFPGESLLARLARQQRYGLPQALHLLEQLSLALDFAHSQRKAPDAARHSFFGMHEPNPNARGMISQQFYADLSGAHGTMQAPGIAVSRALAGCQPYTYLLQYIKVCSAGMVEV